MPLNDQVQCIQYNRNLEVNRSLFTVSQRLLGTGEFGSIYKGELRFSDSDEVQQVAIKVPKGKLYEPCLSFGTLIKILCRSIQSTSVSSAY